MVTYILASFNRAEIIEYKDISVSKFKLLLAKLHISMHHETC